MKTGMLLEKQYTKLVDRLSKKYLGNKYKTKTGEVVIITKLFIDSRRDGRGLDKCCTDKGTTLLLSDLKRKLR